MIHASLLQPEAFAAPPDLIPAVFVASFLTVYAFAGKKRSGLRRIGSFLFRLRHRFSRKKRDGIGTLGWILIIVLGIGAMFLLLRFLWNTGWIAAIVLFLPLVLLMYASRKK